MTLRAKAEAAAKMLHDDLPIRGNYEDNVPTIADAIERVAREFAADALRELMAHPCVVWSGCTQEEFIADAIESAEGTK